MAASLEETLISVWRQAMVEDAKVVTLEDKKFPVPGPADPDCGKWIFNLKGTNCGVLNKILKLLLVGAVGATGKEGDAVP